MSTYFLSTRHQNGSYRMSNALVTGALGFVGGQLAHSLIAEGRDVTLLVREEKLAEARTKFSGANEIISLQDLVDSPLDRIFDTIFHLATVYIYDHSVEDIPDLIAGNITLPATLADIASRWGSKVSFVNVSTFMQHFQGSEYSPTCLYAATKKSIEDILAYYTQAVEGFNTSHLVFPHIYGEADTRTKVLNLLINATKTHTALHLASGKQLLDLVHVSDAVTALKIAETLGTGRWSIGSDKYFSIRELTELVREISEVELDINFDERKDRTFDTFKIWNTAEPLPGWTRKIDLQHWVAQQLTNPDKMN